MPPISGRFFKNLWPSSDFPACESPRAYFLGRCVRGVMFRGIGVGNEPPYAPWHSDSANPCAHLRAQVY